MSIFWNVFGKQIRNFSWWAKTFETDRNTCRPKTYVSFLGIWILKKLKNQSSFTLWGILILIPWNQFWQNRSFRNWKNLYTVDEISFHDKRREFVHSNCFEGLRKRFFFGLTLCPRMKISPSALGKHFCLWIIFWKFKTIFAGKSFKRSWCNISKT